MTVQLTVQTVAGLQDLNGISVILLSFDNDATKSNSLANAVTSKLPFATMKQNCGSNSGLQSKECSSLSCMTLTDFEESITEVCRLVGTNLRRKSAHGHTFGGDFQLKIRSCANSRHKFVPTNLQTS